MASAAPGIMSVNYFVVNAAFLGEIEARGLANPPTLERQLP